MKEKTANILRLTSHIILIFISMCFSVLLFMQFSVDVFGKFVYVLLAIALEIIKVYLFLEVKKFFQLKGFYVFAGVLTFAVYFFIAGISAIATMGFSLNALEKQSFTVQVSNLDREIYLEEIRSIEQEISTKLRQQSELPFNWITASQRFTDQISDLRVERNEILEKLRGLNTEVETDTSDTFSLIGALPWVDMSGKEVMFVLLMVLVVLLEVTIAITAGQIEDLKKKEKGENMKGFLDIKKDGQLPKVSKEKRISGCESCGSYRNCENPKIERTSGGNPKTIILFGQPSYTEDKKKSPYNQMYQKYLYSILSRFSIRKEDMSVAYALQCYQQDSVNPKAIEACHYRLVDYINSVKPERIIVCDETAMKVLYHPYHSGRFSFTSYKKFTGWQIPDQNLKSIIIPIEPPEDAINILKLRRKKILSFKPTANFEKNLWEDPNLSRTDNFKLMDTMIRKQIREGLGKKYQEIEYTKRVVTEDRNEAISLLREFLRKERFAFDIETTGLMPYKEGHRIVSWAFSDGKISVAFPHFNDKKFLRVLKQTLEGDAKKIGAFIGFEHLWCLRLFGIEVNNWVFDAVLASHILDNKKGITSLKFQTFVRCGIIGYDSLIDPYIKSVDKKDIHSFNNIHLAPMKDLLEYGGLDAFYTYKLFEILSEEIKEDRKILEGYKLFHNGTIALTNMSLRGIKVDTVTLENNFRYLEKRAFILIEEIMQCDEIKHWIGEFNVNSNDHLKKLFYDVLKFPIIKRTKKGSPSVDTDTLNEIASVYDVKIAKLIGEYKSVLQTKDTFFSGIKRCMVEGVLHPQFGLSGVTSYRSSSQNPNFQNLPKANEEMKKLVRSVFKPRDGYVLLALDHNSLESYLGVCYHGDSMMKTYLFNPEADPHADNAESVFMCDKAQIEDKFFKSMRVIGKTFSFAMQYGISAKNLAINLWNMGLTKEHKEYLKTKGIANFEAWSDHMDKQYKIYWEEKFKELYEWRNSTWKEYIRNGVYYSKTGFRYNERLTKNQVCNYPIQGSGYHCMQLGINEIDKVLTNNKMKSRPIIEIHDEIIIETHKDEIEEVKKIAYNCFIERVLEKYKWINMPLSMKGEVYSNNWAECEEEFKLEK